MTLPGWNNLETVRTLHSILQFLAIVFFVLLVLFEVFEHSGSAKKTLWKVLALLSLAIAVGFEAFAYPYDRRSETLADKRITDEEKQLRESESEIAVLKKQQEQRHITKEQHDAFIALLKNAPLESRSFPVPVVMINGTPETAILSCEVRQMLNDAGFQVGTAVPFQPSFASITACGVISTSGLNVPNPKNAMIQIFIGDSGKTSANISPMANAIRDAKIDVDAERDKGVEDGKFMLLIPNKPGF